MATCVLEGNFACKERHLSRQHTSEISNPLKFPPPHIQTCNYPFSTHLICWFKFRIPRVNDNEVFTTLLFNGAIEITYCF